MRNLNKLAAVCFAAAMGAMVLTGCEGGDLFGVDSPDWLSSRADSIANAKQGSDEPELEGMEEDVYTIGATDFSTGWWAAFSKYYQIPDGQVWNAIFNLTINPSASNTFKNFALILTNDEDRGAANYLEYGAIRYDNQPSGNSEWGNYIDRSLVESNLTFGTDTDAGVDKLGGRVVLTVDRSNPNAFVVRMTNGTVTKTYTAKSALPNLNADASNTTIRCFIVPEGSYINFLQSNIEPIGGFTSAEDKQPVSMTLNSVPKKVLQGVELNEAMKNVTATVEFEQAVSKTVNADELQFQAIPNFTELGKKTLIAVYNKSYKGEYCAQPVIATADFEVVDKMYKCIGNSDNSSKFWEAHSDNIKVEPGMTFVSNFTNYSSCGANWNNFCVVLVKADNTEYAVVRADNYGWGTGYDACTHTTNAEANWDEWRAAMDGAKVTTYVTNNGDGTADVKAVMVGNNGVTYTQEYKGINTVDPNDFYFRFTIDNSHIEFDQVVGNEDNTTPFWEAHSTMMQVPVGKTFATRFRNYTSGASNWNNFCVVLTREDNSEYAVVRADNFGWGDCYGACTPSGGQADWPTWLKAMDDALVTVSVTNKGGSADVKAVMVGNDGVTYTQDYIGISPIDGDNLYFRFTIDNSHIIFE